MAMTVVSLEQAVRSHVRPGCSIHLAYGGGRPNAAVAEIVRQFWGTRPEFTVSAHGFVSTQHALVSAGLVRRLVVAFAGENYPRPRPNPVLQRALRSEAVAIENWSIWTLTARLIAGALGVPFFPVRSLEGSGIAAEHLGRDYVRADAVSLTGTDGVGLVTPLRPDVVLVHGAAADSRGNVLLAPPYGEGAWGALAARTAVIATVESLVPDDVLTQHNQLPVVPSHAVSAVCVAPFGSHPYGLYAGQVPGSRAYTEDEAFIRAVRRASQSEEDFEVWAKTWILEPESHSAYLAKLGVERTAALTAKVRPRPTATAASPQPRANPVERMVVVAARLIASRVQAAGHTSLLAGIGLAHLAAWLAAKRLEAIGQPVQLLTELGMYDVHPRLGDPYLFASQNYSSCSSLTDVTNILGATVPGARGSCLGVLGAGQIDADGNINSTWTDTGDFLLGSGGANDVASTAAEVLAIAPHDQRRLVKHVSYVTAPGRSVSIIVTDRGVLERQPEGHFLLTRYLAEDGEDWTAAHARLATATGWPFESLPAPVREREPAAEELLLLRGYDPKGIFLGKRR